MAYKEEACCRSKKAARVGAATGAAAGFAIAGPPGAAIGFVAGTLVGHHAAKATCPKDNKK
jgi:uncharacterized membrane protein